MYSFLALHLVSIKFFSFSILRWFCSRVRSIKSSKVLSSKSIALAPQHRTPPQLRWLNKRNRRQGGNQGGREVAIQSTSPHKLLTSVSVDKEEEKKRNGRNNSRGNSNEKATPPFLCWLYSFGLFVLGKPIIIITTLETVRVLGRKRRQPTSECILRSHTTTST